MTRTVQNTIPYIIRNFLLDLIFPRFCLGCSKELDQKATSFICENCFINIPLNGITCHVCSLRNDTGACRRCRGKTFLKGLFAAGQYENEILRKAITKFKYNAIESLKKPLAELLINYIKKEKLTDILSNSILVPIPLTWRRKLSRGFNQSELLAQELSPVLNCQVVNLLKRKKFNAPQAKISDWKKRKENISGAFTVNSNALKLSPYYNQNYRFSESIVVLVDDVTTSGATLEEAASVLKQAGFKEVYGMVIANG